MEDRDIRLRRLAKWKWPDLILHEDDDLLVVNKPQGIASTPGRSSPQRSLEEIAQQHNPDLKAVHRLDKMTTGVLVFAKHAESYSHLSRQFQQRGVYKAYLALVKGQWEFDGFEVEAPIAPAKRGLVKIDAWAGKPALTVFYTEKLYQQATLLRAEPVTGRMHQIRIHLASIHCPIVGDTAYGGTDLYTRELIRRGYRHKPEEEAWPINTEYVLHAWRLGLVHPRTGDDLRIQAPHSPNLAVCLKLLEKHSAE